MHATNKRKSACRILRPACSSETRLPKAAFRLTFRSRKDVAELVTLVSMDGPLITPGLLRDRAISPRPPFKVIRSRTAKAAKQRAIPMARNIGLVTVTGKHLRRARCQRLSETAGYQGQQSGPRNAGEPRWVLGAQGIFHERQRQRCSRIRKHPGG